MSFHVGDRVIHETEGRGEIVKISHFGSILVKLDDGFEVWVYHYQHDLIRPE